MTNSETSRLASGTNPIVTIANEHGEVDYVHRSVFAEHFEGLGWHELGEGHIVSVECDAVTGENTTCGYWHAPGQPCENVSEHQPAESAKLQHPMDADPFAGIPNADGPNVAPATLRTYLAETGPGDQEHHAMREDVRADNDQDPFDYDRHLESWADQLSLPGAVRDSYGHDRRRRFLNPVTLTVFIAAWVVVIALVIAGIAMAQPTTSETAPQEAEQFELVGQFRLTEGATGYAPNGGQCRGYRGYDDIREGTQVTVSSPTGEVLGIGELTSSQYTAAGVCEFEFSVPVPSGHRIYQVEVSHRGSIPVTEDDARSGSVSQRLG